MNPDQQAMKEQVERIQAELYRMIETMQISRHVDQKLLRCGQGWVALGLNSVIESISDQ